MNIENHMVIGSPFPSGDICDYCDGEGFEVEYDEDFGGKMKFTCPKCEGTGYYTEEELLEEEELGDE